MDTFSDVPPGFRFHPTDEELVDYYLRKKVASRKIDLDVIKEVDLYRIEPWDLQEKCKIGAEGQSDWYFFSHKDRKYPTGTRTNRATTAGFWKATGRDKAIYSKHALVGMRKTLVFYKGRAPNGHKSDWIMHEYRLETNENAAPQEEGWVVCRMFKKRVPAIRRPSEHESPCSWYLEDHVPFMPADLNYSPKGLTSPQQPEMNAYHNHHLYSSSKPELNFHYSMMPHDPLFLQLPQLESPNYVNQQNALNSSSLVTTEEQVTDWRVLDKFVAAQLSHDDKYGAIKEPNFHVLDKQEAAAQYASTSNSSGQLIHGSDPVEYSI